MTGVLGVSGLGDFSLAALPDTHEDSVTFNATAALALQTNYVDLTFAADAGLTFACELQAYPSVSLAAEATANFDVETTFAATLTFPVEATADFDVEATFETALTFPVAANADFDLETAFELAIAFLVEATTDFDIETTFETALTFPVAANADFNVEVTFEPALTFPVAANADFSSVTFKFGVGTNTLVLATDAAFVRSIPRAASNNLVFVQTATRTAAFNRSVANTLLFFQGQHRRTQFTPDFIEIPGAVGIVARNFVVLRSGKTTIVLPVPKLGDMQNRGGSLLLKRSVIGDLFTYVKNSDLQTLHYEFELGRLKGRELLAFLEKHIDDPITVLNWKGEQWRVNIVNNPFEGLLRARWAPCLNTDVVIDFEGVQL